VRQILTGPVRCTSKIILTIQGYQYFAALRLYPVNYEKYFTKMASPNVRTGHCFSS